GPEATTNSGKANAAINPVARIMSFPPGPASGFQTAPRDPALRTIRTRRGGVSNRDFAAARGARPLGPRRPVWGASAPAEHRADTALSLRPPGGCSRPL